MSATPPWEQRNLAQVPYMGSSSSPRPPTASGREELPLLGTTGNKTKESSKPEAGAHDSPMSIFAANSPGSLNQRSAEQTQSPVGVGGKTAPTLEPLTTTGVPHIVQTDPTPVEPGSASYPTDQLAAIREPSIGSTSQSGPSRNASIASAMSHDDLGPHALSRDSKAQTPSQASSRAGSPLPPSPRPSASATVLTPSRADPSSAVASPNPALAAQELGSRDEGNQKSSSADGAKGIRRRVKNALGGIFRRERIDEDSLERIEDRHWTEQD